MIRRTIAGVALTAALVVPASMASASPLQAQVPVADSGSASSGSASAGSATQSLCLLLRMLRAGYVDSSGSTPACTFL
ncbi:hypothetical protein [Nocardia lijiangensis]|uniref:hypothetical protein n=1 Tax=Nocardia lijiangensis TaxID=299618 RepID=UPI003D74D5ED